MNNMLNYISLRGDVTFKQSPFNDVDAMILSILVALEFKGVFYDGRPLSFPEVLQRYWEKVDRDLLDERTPDKEELLRLVAGSKRFSGIQMTDYVKDINDDEVKTFYAVTFLINPFTQFVAFRGTAGSVVSWKENFRTLCIMPTAGQNQAKEYLESAISKRPFQKVLVGGHSKGANLAVYASMFCTPKSQKRIKRIYALDGPGFMEDISEKPEYLAIKDRVTSIIPRGSVVGRLMYPPYKNIVVSAEGRGIYQHDTFQWHVNAYGFETVDSTDEVSENLSKKINDWITGMPLEDRAGIVDELFDVFIKNNVLHINNLLHMDFKTIIGMLRSAVRLSQENRTFLNIIIQELLDK